MLHETELTDGSFLKGTPLPSGASGWLPYSFSIHREHDTVSSLTTCLASATCPGLPAQQKVLSLPFWHPGRRPGSTVRQSTSLRSELQQGRGLDEQQGPRTVNTSSKHQSKLALIKHKSSGIVLLSWAFKTFFLSILSTSEALASKQACEMWSDISKFIQDATLVAGTQACNTLCQIKSTVVACHPYLIL